MTIKITVGIMDSTDNPDEEYEMITEVVDDDLLNYSRDRKGTIKALAAHLADQVYTEVYGVSL